MYLKALELQGFKSFPEKTRITFQRSVTAIVGPNGSGKSNISDALLWVMGEQRTRALRGGKMEDVIFGGTEKRSPMGFAQVSLILDNSARIVNRDSDEVTLTRRYYRSGESEYYINKEAVRLRDLTELLMDTGLGRDGYSIIGQGRIAEIVSAKSTDRREIFEEAAGISRYRYRKEESERKLEKTEENLLRVGDKISELELQVGPLREQAETAKKYLLLRDELRLLEISLWMENLDRLHDQSEGLRNDYDASVTLRDTAKTELDALYAASESAAEKMRESDLEAERQRELLRAEEGTAAETESAAAVLRSNISNNNAALERLRREMSEQAERSGSLRAQIDEHRQRLEKIGADRVALSLEARELRRQAAEAESGRDEQNAALSALLVRESELNGTLAENKSAVALLTENSEGFARRADELTAGAAAAREKRAETEKTRQDAEAALRAAQEQVTRTGNMVSGRAMLLQGRERDSAELAEQKARLTAELRGMDSRLSLLRELEKDYEGFNKAVKTVMREAEHGVLRGVHGPVARLIRTDDRYALAVETALGAAAQNIVVDTQNDGKSAIELLKKREGGRATFLPLDVIRPSSLRDEPRQEPGYVDVCSRLVRCDERYADIVANLLGRTVVAETLSDAIRIARSHQNSFRIVTLDGQMINAGGSMTGGSAGQNTGILSRANELARLDRERVTLETSLKDTTVRAMEADRRLELLRTELEGAREENAAARQEQSRREGGLAQARLLFDAADAAIRDLDAEQAGLASRRQECSGRIAALNDGTAAAERELEALRANIGEQNRGVEGFDQRRKELEESLSELRARDASLEAEKQTVALAAEQLEGLRADMENESGTRRDAIAAAEARGADLSGELAEREARLAELKARIGKRQEGVASLTRQRMELEGKRVAHDKAAQEKNRELLELERACARLEQKKLAADLEEKQIVDKLWDTYELSRSAAQTLRQPLESYSKTGKRVGELRREIGALGTPNLGAIDEYKRVSERYDFLTAQRDDISKSKGEIEGIIRDITDRMEQIFVTEFKAIDERFRATFLELFGGGKAALSLEDESDVLNCGIDIRIQPPGKALSNISLLSGGEKAFVAIALYFAIMKVRPTPFCVMDEIESALDEANVALFAAYLQKMSEKTQFIVITHRRGTMESAEQLYGITMQEKGVSTVLSMDMQEAMKVIK